MAVDAGADAAGTVLDCSTGARDLANPPPIRPPLRPLELCALAVWSVACVSVVDVVGVRASVGGRDSSSGGIR